MIFMFFTMEYSRNKMEYSLYTMVNLLCIMENSQFKMVNLLSLFNLKINDGIFSVKNGKLTVYYGKFTESSLLLNMEYSPSCLIKMVNSL